MTRASLLIVCVLFACRGSENATPEAPPVPVPSAPPAEEAQAIEQVERAPAVEEAAAEKTAVAQEAKPETSCHVSGYVADPDPAGLNVRGGPSVRDGVIGKIAKDPDGTVVNVVGAKGGWLQITRAQPMNDDPYDIEGWVSGRMIETSSRCPDDNPGPDCTFALHATPDAESDVVKRLPVGAVVRIVGCDEDWVEGETPEADRTKRVRGWMPPQAQCPNPVTTCP